MSLFRDFISWSRTERSRLVRRIELVESGGLEADDDAENPETVEPTTDIIARARHRLAELDALLAKYSEADD